MKEPTLVMSLNLKDIDATEELLVSLSEAGLNATRGQHPHAGLASLEYGLGELVTIWVAARTAEAALGHVVPLAVDWMRNQFRRHPEDQHPKAVLITVYDEDRVKDPDSRWAAFEGRPTEIVELKSPDAEPVRATSKDLKRQLQEREEHVREMQRQVRESREQLALDRKRLVVERKLLEDFAQPMWTSGLWRNEDE